MQSRSQNRILSISWLSPSVVPRHSVQATWGEINKMIFIIVHIAHDQEKNKLTLDMANGQGGPGGSLRKAAKKEWLFHGRVIFTSKLPQLFIIFPTFVFLSLRHGITCWIRSRRNEYFVTEENRSKGILFYLQCVHKPKCWILLSLIRFFLFNLTNLNGKNPFHACWRAVVTLSRKLDHH